MNRLAARLSFLDYESDGKPGIFPLDGSIVKARKFAGREQDMENQETKHDESVGEMHKNRELMADGRRYIIYYTFGNNEETAKEMPEDFNLKTEERENV